MSYQVKQRLKYSLAWVSSRNRPGYAGARLTVLKAASLRLARHWSLTGLLLPANDAPGFDRQERTAVARRNALWLGGLNHGEDGQFGLRF